MDFKEISSYTGKKRNRGGHMAMPELVNRGLGFVRREWPLCLFAVLSMSVIATYDDASMRRVALAGMLGGLFCLKRFGLDHCFWIYLLAAVLTFPTGIPLADAKALQASHEPLRPWGVLFICLVFGSLRGMLASIPFSLLFLRAMGGFSALWKVPLCTFFIILALEPIFFGLAVMILWSFTPCP